MVGSGVKTGHADKKGHAVMAAKVAVSALAAVPHRSYDFNWFTHSEGNFLGCLFRLSPLLFVEACLFA